MIFDPSGTATYCAPSRVEILECSGKTETSGVVHYLYFNLDTDDVQVFLTQIKTLIDKLDILLGEKLILSAQEAQHPEHFLVMTVWTTRHEVYELQNTPALATVQEYFRRAASAHGLLEAGYTVIDPQQK